MPTAASVAVQVGRVRDSTNCLITWKKEQKGTLPAAFRPTPFIHKPVKLVLRSRQPVQSRQAPLSGQFCCCYFLVTPCGTGASAAQIQYNLLQSEQVIAGLVLLEQAEHRVQRNALAGSVWNVKSLPA
jgi:hypothetical protein